MVVTCVWTSGVLDAAKVSLGPDALSVVSVGQLEASRVHVVEGHKGSGDALEEIKVGNVVGYSGFYENSVIFDVMSIDGKNLQLVHIVPTILSITHSSRSRPSVRGYKLM